MFVCDIVGWKCCVGVIVYFIDVGGDVDVDDVVVGDYCWVGDFMVDDFVEGCVVWFWEFFVV